MKFHLVKIRIHVTTKTVFDIFSFVGIDNPKSAIDATLPTNRRQARNIRKAYYKNAFHEFKLNIH
jgi:hypothetical protein